MGSHYCFHQVGSAPNFCHFGSVDRLTEDRKGHDDATAFSLMATFSITAARPSRCPNTEHRVSGPSVQVTEVRIAAESSTEPNRTDPMEAVLVIHGPNSTESDLSHPGETTYRVG